MPTVHYIAKEATPEQLGWRARIAAAEKPLMAAFNAWVADLHAMIQESAIAHAILTRATTAFDHVVQAVRFEPVILPIARAEAVREYEQVVRGVGASLRLSFDLHDPNFDTAVREHEARLVREVTTETRRAISNMIERGYRQGIHPYEVAPQIRAAVGLTSRQAQAVLNYSDALTKKGVAPQTVADRSIRYAAKMRTRRAKTIGRTETARAAVQGRLASYEQAAAHGLFDPATAQLEWSAVQQDPMEVCAQLDGRRVPYEAGSFDGLLPPAHVNCRCSVHLAL